MLTGHSLPRNAAIHPSVPKHDPRISDDDDDDRFDDSYTLVEKKLSTNTVQYKILHGRGGKQVTFKEAIELWQIDEKFQSICTTTLKKESKFDAYCWECPPITKSDANDVKFEFVLVNAPYFIGRKPDIHSFAEHFRRNSGKSVISFYNLGMSLPLSLPFLL